MNNYKLSNFLASNIGIDKGLIEALIENCKFLRFAKGDFLLRQGEVGKHSFFVEQGLLRYYSIDNKGKEHILQFAPE